MNDFSSFNCQNRNYLNPNQSELQEKIDESLNFNSKMIISSNLNHLNNSEKPINEVACSQILNNISILDINY